MELTTQQEKVLSALRKAKKPLSAYAVLDALRTQGVRSPPIVYRALEKLQGAGLVHRVESLGAFVACRHTHGKGPDGIHAFAICSQCGAVEELCAPSLAKSLGRKSGGLLAEINHSMLEISGLCHGCVRGACAKKNTKKGSGACSQ
ncbi:MAG: Fur family transcriptional regulator [Alphaproteobacteria bacterium]|nr:Fur family transcriptional regulator [Alphaproteobacteria bacterium]